MCGRSSLTKTEIEIEIRFNATFYSDELERYNPLPNYNIAPTHYTPVVTSADSDHLSLMQWGLIPAWAKDRKIGSKMINARLETIKEKPVFKRLVSKNRCIVPMDGFYEWQKTPGGVIPHRIILSDQNIFSVAGIWETWQDPATREIIHSYSVITIPANSMMKFIHDRMPAILHPDTEKTWLDQALAFEQIEEILQPYESDLMRAYPVSTKVNNVKNNDATLLEPIQIKPIQGSLF
jgi:putative SOS response-associated peptidase YedK